MPGSDYQPGNSLVTHTVSCQHGKAAGTASGVANLKPGPGWAEHTMQLVDALQTRSKRQHAVERSQPSQ